MCVSGALEAVPRGEAMKRDKLTQVLAAALYHLSKGMEPQVVQAKLLSQLGGAEDKEVGSDAEDRIFAFWVATFSKTSRTQFTPERRARVRARLRDSTEDEIRAAIRGCKASPFHMGENDTGKLHDDIILICRDRSKLEGFMALVGDAVIELSGDHAQMHMLKQQYQDAQNANDTPRQNVLSQQSRALREGAHGR